MIITVVGYKGGVGKTTTAIHLAAYLQERGSTLLVDGDPNHSASRWVERSSNFPVTVMAAETANTQLSIFQHVVIDTQARPSPTDLQDLAHSCDLMVLPCSPDALALEN
jgi:chromosome partitioning protein